MIASECVERPLMDSLIRYDEALALCRECEGAHGLDDDVYGKLYGNRAECHLQLGHFEQVRASNRLESPLTAYGSLRWP